MNLISGLSEYTNINPPKKFILDGFKEEIPIDTFLKIIRLYNKNHKCFISF